MLLRFGEYFLAKDMRGYLLVLSFTLISGLLVLGLLGAIIFGAFASIMVALITLHKGNKAGLATLAWVALPAIAYLAIRQLSSYDVLLLQATLTYFIAVLKRRGWSFGRICQVLVVMGIVGVIAIHGFVPELKEHWVKVIVAFQQQLGQQSWLFSLYKKGDLIASVASVMTGILTLCLLIGTMIQLLLARLWQSMLFSPGTFRSEVANITMPRYLVLIFFGYLISLTWLGHFSWATDIYPLLLLPFVISGLSFLHYLVLYDKSYFFLLITGYVALLLIATIGIFLTGLLGMVDCVVKLRRFFQLPKPNGK